MGMTTCTTRLVAILLAGVAGVAIVPGLVVPAAAFDGPTQTTGGKKAAPAKPASAAAKPGQAAPQGEDNAPDKSKAAENAARILDLGIKAYQGGDTKNAVKALDAALQSGALNHQQMAHALYYRGLTHRKDGKPGLAISDLTAAIWLKDGLTTTERQEAARHRVAAYQEAGIGDVPDFSPPTSAPATATASAAPAPGATGSASTQSPGAPVNSGSAQTAAAAPASSGGFFSSFSNFFTGGGSSSTPAPKADEGVTTASLAEPKPAAPAVANSWNDTVQVAPKGAASAQPASSEALPWTSASAAPTAAPAPAQPSENLPWASAAKAPAAASSAPIATAAIAPPTAGKHAGSKSPSGKYVMQVAAVRSREEADMLVARLLTEHGGELGGRDPRIDEAVIGNMGTFYRVRVGPYADATEPKQLCGTLHGNGFDCLVVTN
jgi:cell division protein FtsN